MSKISTIFLMLCLFAGMKAQNLPPVFGTEYAGKTFKDNRARAYITPQRIVWKYDGRGTMIKNPETLLVTGHTGQSALGGRKSCTMRSTDNERPAILLDFGREIQGGIQFVTTGGTQKPSARIRVRFGESVSEAMSNIGEAQNATNDHAMRDFTMELPWMGVAEAGNSGFRFVRIDLLDPDVTLDLQEINAIFVYRDIPYLGSFSSNDERLNRIWMTGAYTVHLNMQEYIWDGIKRDRLVWLGDLHPEVMTVNTVFGYNEVIPKSLDLARDITPLPGWMNGMSSYSLWWIIIHRDWYMYQGNLAYLKEQQPYLSELLRILFKKIDPATGREKLDGGRFLDHPTSSYPENVHAGLQALMVMAMQAGGDLCTALGDATLAKECSAAAERLRAYIPPHNQSKQAAALQALADMIPAEQADKDVLSVGGSRNFSTFYGYYMLEAQAKAGNYQEAIDNISRYWGGMLDLGATTFWEDFNLDWIENAAGIDEFVPAGKKDIHADFGDYCYVKLRHSLCHGWASGPTAWLTKYVLGVQVVAPGCKVLKIEPHLGNLDHVEGTFPTPQGIVSIKHSKDADGKIKTDVKAPKGIKILR